MERASAIFMDEVWGSTVGSPKKVLRFQTWYFAWTIGCFVCFAVQVAIGTRRVPGIYFGCRFGWPPRGVPKSGARVVRNFARQARDP